MGSEMCIRDSHRPLSIDSFYRQLELILAFTQGCKAWTEKNLRTIFFFSECRASRECSRFLLIKRSMHVFNRVSCVGEERREAISSWSNQYPLWPLSKQRPFERRWRTAELMETAARFLSRWEAWRASPLLRLQPGTMCATKGDALPKVKRETCGRAAHV